MELDFNKTWEMIIHANLPILVKNFNINKAWKMITHTTHPISKPLR